MTLEKYVFKFSHLILALTVVISVSARNSGKTRPIMIKEQGSFAAGGTLINNPGTFDQYNQTPAGQSFYSDYACLFYHIPVKASQYPLVKWHGMGQLKKPWEISCNQTEFNR